MSSVLSRLMQEPADAKRHAFSRSQCSIKRTVINSISIFDDSLFMQLSQHREKGQQREREALIRPYTRIRDDRSPVGQRRLHYTRFLKPPDYGSGQAFQLPLKQWKCRGEISGSNNGRSVSRLAIK